MTVPRDPKKAKALIELLNKDMGQEINKALTEAMGLCWHEWRLGHEDRNKRSYVCINCDSSYLARWGENWEKPTRFINPDFSTWEGFGILWEWAIKQEWWFTFVADEIWYSPNYTDISGRPFIPVMDIINPEKFANAIYKFLKEK